MKLKYYLYIALALVLLIAALQVYSGYRELQELRVEKQKIAQNAKAWEDSAKARYEREQVLTVFVRNLNNKINQRDRLIIALETKNSILLDSIRVLNQPSGDIVVTDTTVKVPFEGSKGIADYKGNTVANTKTGKGTYSIDIWFPRPILTTHKLFRDPVDSFWKIETVGLTDGVKVLGTSTLDTGIWQEIESGLRPPKEPDFLALGGMFIQDGTGKIRPHLGIGIKPAQYMITLQYNVSSYEQSVSWEHRISIGAFWFLL